MADFLSGLDPFSNARPDLGGFSRLHRIADIGVITIAIAMVNMKVWDLIQLNGRDSKGAAPLI